MPFAFDMNILRRQRSKIRVHECVWYMKIDLGDIQSNFLHCAQVVVNTQQEGSDVVGKVWMPMRFFFVLEMILLKKKMCEILSLSVAG